MDREYMSEGRRYEVLQFQYGDPHGYWQSLKYWVRGRFDVKK